MPLFPPPVIPGSDQESQVDEVYGFAWDSPSERGKTFSASFLASTRKPRLIESEVLPGIPRQSVERLGKSVKDGKKGVENTKVGNAHGNSLLP